MAGRRKSKQFWVRFALIAPPLLLLVAAATVYGFGAWRLSEERRWAREHGHPLAWGELALPPVGEGEDPGPWLEALTRASEAPPLRDRNQVVDWLPYGFDQRWLSDEDLAALELCARASSPLEEEWHDAIDEACSETFRLLRDGRAFAELTECQRLIARCSATTSADSVHLALAVERYRRLEPAPPATDGPGVYPLLWAGDSLQLNSRLAAWQGDRESALAGVRALLTIHDRLTTQTGLQSFLAVVRALEQGLDSLDWLLLCDPSADGLEDVLHSLEEVDVWEQLQYCLRGERVWLLSILDELREQAPTNLLYELVHRYDIALLMGYWREMQEATTRRETYDVEEPWKYALLTRTLAPSSSYVRAAVDVDVRLALARGALIGRLHGPAAAAAYCEATPDPYGSGMLRSYVEPDGTLVLWSVGENGIDDRASEELQSGDPLDVVWRHPSPR